MLSVEQMLSYYPKTLLGYRVFILREYLQHKILQAIYEHTLFAEKLCFLGGTCLRIVHGNSRFSEDLDFDNLGLSEEDFESVADHIKLMLSREGYEVEIRTVFRGAFHCYIRFPNLLFQSGLSGYQEQKILIQLDTEPQHFDFAPEAYILNRFDVFGEIKTTPPAILLSQKFYAIVNRKRSKGRDFYDVVFLLGSNTKPDYRFLEAKLGINTPTELKDRVLETCSKLDMDEMARDVAPFLFRPNDSQKVSLFPHYLKQVSL